MDIHQLRTFLAVLEHESFSRAADALHVTQSTVSFHIKSLESALDVVLVERRRGAARATSAGRVLESYATRIVALREEALAQLGLERTGAVGHIAVAASTIPGEFLLPPALARLRRESPGLSVTTEMSDSGRALGALRAQTCDLAIVGARERDKRVVYTPVAVDEVVLVARPDDPLAEGGGPLSPEAFARAPLVLRGEGSGTRSAVADLLAERSGAGARTPSVRVGSTAAARQCVLHGLGMTFISRLAVAEDLAQGRLVEVALPGTPVARQFFAARLRATEPSAAVGNLIRCLEAEGARDRSHHS